MFKKKIIRVMSSVLCAAIGFSSLTAFSACTKKKSSIVLMTEELSGLFNPFYATSGTDQDVVGMTQIGMLSTDDAGKSVAGDEYSTVVKDFDYEVVGNNEKTVYTFVIKNGLKFSDGKPLTMNDVLFNMYEYLDPVYTGSSTMYSIDIEGLSAYRTQSQYAGDGNDAAMEQMNKQAAALASLRKLELVTVFEDNGLIDGSQSSYSMTDAEMREAIAKHNVSDGYKTAVATADEILEMTDEDFRAQLLADYEFTLDTFKKELESDFTAAKESYDLTTAPYNEWKDELSNDIFKFFLYEGKIIPEYEIVQGKTNREKIVKFSGTTNVSKYSKESAIQTIFEDTTEEALNAVLTQWGTSGTLTTEYTAAAIDVQLRNLRKDDGSLLVPNISGIVSLGHTTTTESVTFTSEVSKKEVTYNVAQSHNEDGTPVGDNVYDVLQITVKGTDPKAIYNFGFTVAPAHYYSADEEYPNGRPIDIEANQFGVDFASSKFQSKTIQSQQHVEVPVGAGPFAATNADNESNPDGADFWNSNIVYFKANDNFMFPVKAKKIRFQVVSSANALDKLQSGEVDYITPQFTKQNGERLEAMTKKGFTQLQSWQLGYGYIGINAGKVQNVNIRRAIMAAMQTSLAVDYYATGTCKPIDWPMSMVSWAYPYEDDGKTSLNNNTDYMQWTDTTQTNYANAKAEIQKYMNAAGVTDAEKDSRLEIKFTIAGASITEHPTYAVFKQAAELLNDMGWRVEVKADSQALTKLSTGSLAVWAAAWGSTIDPDMYQVYHKNSSATSVYAWGYREIKANPTLYSYENGVINELSALIDEGRAYMDDDTRKPIYQQAMQLVLDLAVEMPVYQRMTLYAYNNKTVKGFAEDVNEYSSPLEEIWNLELVS